MCGGVGGGWFAHIIFKAFELFPGEQASGVRLQQYGSILSVFLVFPGQVAARVLLQCDSGTSFASVLQEALPGAYHGLETH